MAQFYVNSLAKLPFQIEQYFHFSRVDRKLIISSIGIVPCTCKMPVRCMCIEIKFALFCECCFENLWLFAPRVECLLYFHRASLFFPVVLGVVLFIFYFLFYFPTLCPVFVMCLFVDTIAHFFMYVCLSVCFSLPLPPFLHFFPQFSPSV